MDQHRTEEPVFDLGATPLGAGLEAAFGNSENLDKIAPKPEPAPEKKSWMSWDRGADPDRGR